MKRFFRIISCTVAVSLVLFFIPGKARSAEYLEGMIEPYLEVKISSQVPGIIDEVLVERGDLVKKGQIVARLRAGVEKAEVKLAAVQVAIQQAQARSQPGALCRGAHLGE